MPTSIQLILVALLYVESAEGASNFSSSPDKTLLPGAILMAKGYNMLSGEPMYLQLGGGADLIDYQYDGSYVTYDDIEYEYPIEFVAKPYIVPFCGLSLQTNSVYYSTSTSILTEQSDGYSVGYSQTTDLGVTIPDIPITAKTSITNALKHGSSSQSKTARVKSSESYAWSFSLDYAATLYQASISWNTFDTFQWTDTFVGALMALDAAPTNKNILSFINEYGSHVMTAMTAGSSCKESAYISSKQTKEEAVDFQRTVTQDSGSWLFFSGEKSSTSTQTKASTTETGVEYTFSYVECNGEVVVTSACGAMSGEKNNPHATSYELLPIWHINDLLSNATKISMDAFIVNVYDTLQACRDTICNSKGVCTLSDTIWNSQFVDSWDGIDFAQLWDVADNTETYCFCDRGAVGPYCSQTWYWELFTSVDAFYGQAYGHGSASQWSVEFPNWSGLYSQDIMFVDEGIGPVTYNIKQTGTHAFFWTGVNNGTVVEAAGTIGGSGYVYSLYVADVRGYAAGLEHNTFRVKVYKKVHFDLTVGSTDGVKQYAYYLAAFMSGLCVFYM